MKRIRKDEGEDKELKVFHMDFPSFSRMLAEYTPKGSSRQTSLKKLSNIFSGNQNINNCSNIFLLTAILYFISLQKGNKTKLDHQFQLLPVCFQFKRRQFFLRLNSRSLKCILHSHT